MEYVITVVSGTVLTTVTGIFIATIKSGLKIFHSLQTSQRALIKDRIVQAHDYFMKKGEIPKPSFETLEEMFIEYEKLGGNGYIFRMMDDLRRLPIK